MHVAHSYLMSQAISQKCLLYTVGGCVLIVNNSASVNYLLIRTQQVLHHLLHTSLVASLPKSASEIRWLNAKFELMSQIHRCRPLKLVLHSPLADCDVMQHYQDIVNLMSQW